jgi:hypothetical protein
MGRNGNTPPHTLDAFIAKNNAHPSTVVLGMNKAFIDWNKCAKPTSFYVIIYSMVT